MTNKIIFILLLPTCRVGARENDNVFADIGDSKVYTSEFLERFELTPKFKRQNESQTEALKLEFLFTLIAEKPWAKSASEHLPDTSFAIRTAEKFIEKIYVRDALYKIEVTDNFKLLAKNKKESSLNYE